VMKDLESRLNGKTFSFTSVNSELDLDGAFVDAVRWQGQLWDNVVKESGVKSPGKPRKITSNIAEPGTYNVELELWDRMYRINLRTAVALTRAVVPAMLGRGGGSIANISSRAALDRPAGLGAYSAAKAAVLALSEIVQKEVGDRRVRVNTIIPTTIDTPANRAAMPNADFSQWTPPAKIAEVVYWLSSDAGATVRGALVPV